MRRVAVNWEMTIAATTKYYGWSPRDVLGLKLSELLWWHRMARRMESDDGN